MKKAILETLVKVSIGAIFVVGTTVHHNLLATTIIYICGYALMDWYKNTKYFD